jgi:hypothetical protein
MWDERVVAAIVKAAREDLQQQKMGERLCR